MPSKAIAQRLPMRLAAIVAACFVLAGAALADGAPGGVASLDPVAEWERAAEQELVPLQRNCMSLSEAVARAKRQGKVISAETRGRRHVVKVLTSDNRVKTLNFPACG